MTQPSDEYFKNLNGSVYAMHRHISDRFARDKITGKAWLSMHIDVCAAHDPPFTLSDIERRACSTCPGGFESVLTSVRRHIANDELAMALYMRAFDTMAAAVRPERDASLERTRKNNHPWRRM